MYLIIIGKSGTEYRSPIMNRADFLEEANGNAVRAAKLYREFINFHEQMMKGVLTEAILTYHLDNGSDLYIAGSEVEAVRVCYPIDWDEDVQDSTA